MLMTVLGFLSGLAPMITHVSDDITRLKVAHVQADSDEKKQNIAAQIAEAQARQNVLVAEAWSRVNSLMRAAIAFGPMIYINKYYFFDKVIGSFFGNSCNKAGECSIFSTDGINDQMGQVLMAVIGFYFVYDIAATFRRK